MDTSYSGYCQNRWDNIHNYVTYGIYSDWTKLNSMLCMERNTNRRLRAENKRLKRKFSDVFYQNMVLSQHHARVPVVAPTAAAPAAAATKHVYMLIPPTDYEHISEEQMTQELISLYENMKNIRDIIALKEHPHRFDLNNNTKFRKLYSIIPKLIELNNMIGMEKIKEVIFEHICYFIQGMNEKNELMHIVITGKAGSGKTTLAHIIGQIYLRLGFLDNDAFVTAKRADLIGEYLGQTAPKTQKMIDKAQGGVLFIDEIYSLGNNERRDSYAKECIDTINLNLTEGKGKFLCIIAGYEKEVETCFFAYNEGLKRRFPIRYSIEDYTTDELREIFFKMLRESHGWTCANGAGRKAFFRNNKSKFIYAGGDMELLLQRSKFIASKRMMRQTINNIPNKIIVQEDMDRAAIEIVEARKSQADEIPFGMYN